MSTSTKATNPKETAGDGRVPLALCSPVAHAHWAVAQYGGGQKYGFWNWRAAGVKYMTYLSAIKRHVDGLLAGEEFDPIDGTRHEGNIMACAAILLDAREAGMLVDDRPPVLSHRAVYASMEALMKELKAKYAHVDPKHWSIADELEAGERVHQLGAPAPASGAPRKLALRKEQQPVPRRNR